MPQPLVKTGYQPPTTIDPRNFIYEKAIAPAPFPPSYKTDISAIPVFMQSKVPDCVENAVTFVKKYHEYKTKGAVTDLSRRFLAIITVQRDGFPLDDGTNLQNALYEAHSTGICESQYLADDHSLPTATFASTSFLTNNAYANATMHKIASYAFLSDKSVNGLKNAIYQNGVVVVGAIINQNWWTAKDSSVSWNALDILPIRPPTTRDPKVDPTLSGHAFVLYGYDDQYFYFVNSFGPTWGEQGRGYFKVDEIPFIYEAATIIDLTAIQIQTLKQTQQEVQQVADVIETLPPNPNPVVLSALSQILILISNFIKLIFNV
jgi:hypothetical protein